MNYGKQATDKKLKAASSSTGKYKNRFILGSFKTFLIFVCVFGAIGISMGIGMFRGIIDNAPGINIESIVPQGFATIVYDSAGNLTDTLVTADSNRGPATYEELLQDLIDVFMAIEDSRFQTHNGIDMRSILRAVKGVPTGDSSAGGGSTLTRQLIKNNVLEGGREASFGEKLERKFQEQYLAVKLAKSMDRRLIITSYLNTINLGNNALGVKVAVRRYFNREVSDLTLSERAVIAGITQNPSRLNPISGKEENEAKRKVILQYMFEQGCITKKEQEEALTDDVYPRIQNVDMITKENITPYSYLTDELTAQVKEALMEQLGYTSTQTHDLLCSGDLQIYTARDPVLQAIVDEEVNNPENYTVVRYSIEYRLSVAHSDDTITHHSQENVKSWHKQVLGDSGYTGLYNSKEEVQADVDAHKVYLLTGIDKIIDGRLTTTLQPQVSFVLMDQATGQVKAINGGREEKATSLTLSRAINTKRQLGSTFKVVTAFAPAIDTCGSTLGAVYYDAPYTVGQKTFRNQYSTGYQGYSSIRDGIVYPMSIVAVRCMIETVMPQLGVEYAKNFGITTLTSNDFSAVTAPGGITAGVTNLELTSAYVSIANGDVYIKPIFFTKIIDHNGKVLINNEPEAHQVLKDSTAFFLTDAMEDSIISNRMFARAGAAPSSTGTRVKTPGMITAGKSGITSSNADIWFVGYTPHYTAGVWAGCDDNQKLLGGAQNNGGTSFHKDIWRKIMTRVHEGKEDPGLEVPNSVETTQICCKSGKLAVPGLCPVDPRGNAVYTEYFAKGTVSTEVCSNYVAVTVCEESGLLSMELCPSKVSWVFITIPAGETGGTCDSIFGLPGAECNIHNQSSTISGPEVLSDTDGNNYGPGYVPSPSPTQGIISSYTSPPTQSYTIPYSNGLFSNP